MSAQDGGSTLQRVAVSREDSGTYVCWAENRVGRVQAVSFVHVKGEAPALGFALETGWAPSDWPPDLGTSNSPPWQYISIRGTS